MTNPLSTAAQAVLDAFFASDWEDEPLHANIAAALRAVADQVVPETLTLSVMSTTMPAFSSG